MKITKPAARSSKLSARRITGQGMTEYIIILALIALASVVAVGLFGDAVQAQFGAMGLTLSGESGAPGLTAGKLAADAAVTEAGTASTLKSYAN